MNSKPDKSICPAGKSSHSARVILMGVIILAAGMVIGAAMTTIIIRHKARQKFGQPGYAPIRITENLKHRLNLNDEQFDQIKPIIRQHMEALRKIQDQARPQIQAELKEMHEDISELLTDEQKDRWENHIARLQKSFERQQYKRKGGRGSHGRGRGDGRGGRRESRIGGRGQRSHETLNGQKRKPEPFRPSEANEYPLHKPEGSIEHD